MIWLIVIVILGYLLITFYLSMTKDKDDLQGITLDKKFGAVVNIINDFAFNGLGEVTTLDLREFNLYKERANQLIKFQYGTGSLTITWKYKYFQKEVVHSKQFDNVRNLSIFEQEAIAQNMIHETNSVIENHILRVNNQIN